MAEEAKKSKIQDTEDSGFGNYKEEVGGGGSPKAKDPNQRAPGVNSDYRKTNNNTMQPRTQDGKFSYKSLNGQSIDPKYGPSRGKTVNPLLTGGKNGVLIEDVEEQFGSKSGAIWDKYKDKWYQKGGEFVLSDLKTHVSARSVWEVARGKYDSVKGEFQGESELFKEVKTGKKSAEEIAARQKAEATGSEQAVLDKAGGIKVAPGTIQAKTYIKPKAEPVAKEMPKKSEVLPTGGMEEKKEEKISVTNIANEPFGSGKYTMGEAEAVKDYIKSQMGDEFDESEWDDATLEDFIDNSGGKEIFAKKEVEAPEKESESETVKKIKDLGFSE